MPTSAEQERAAMVPLLSRKARADAVLAASAIQKASELFGVHPRDLTGYYRYAFVVAARFAVYAGLRDAGWTAPRVAVVMDRDHQTIRNGWYKADLAARHASDYAEKINQIADAVRAATQAYTGE